MYSFSIGIDPKSSTLRNANAFLSKNGLFEVDCGRYLLTDKGHLAAEQLAGKIVLPKSNDEVHDRCREQIKAKAGGRAALAIFDFLLKNDPSTHITKADIGQGLNMDVKKSTYRNAMATLRKLNLIEDSLFKKGAFRLASKVFPLGRKKSCAN